MRGAAPHYPRLEAAGADDRAVSRTDAEVLLLCLHDIMLAGAAVADAFHARLPSHESHGLGVVALHAIHRAGRRGLPQVELARQLGKSASSATRLVDSLERSGMIARQPHPSDRRVNIVTLTEAGLGVLTNTLGDLAAVLGVDRRLDGLVESDFRSKLNLLTSLPMKLTS